VYRMMNIFIGLSLSLDYLLHVVFGVFVPRTPLVMS